MCPIKSKRMPKRFKGVRLYRVTVEHDTGTKIIFTGATSIMQARENIKNHEHCPDSAILAVLKVENILKGK